MGQKSHTVVKAIDPVSKARSLALKALLTKASHTRPHFYQEWQGFGVGSGGGEASLWSGGGGKGWRGRVLWGDGV